MSTGRGDACTCKGPGEPCPACRAAGVAMRGDRTLQEAAAGTGPGISPEVLAEHHDTGAAPTLAAPPPARMRGFTRTFTGRKFWPLNPRAEDVAIEDIAHHLSMICRYGGATRFHYSVGQHSILVSSMVPAELALEGLLHDAAEAYLGDMVRPIKRSPELAYFPIAERLVEDAIAQAFGLRTDPEALAAIKRIDDQILVDEVRALSASPEPADHDAVPELAPLGVPIVRRSPGSVEREFLNRFHTLVAMRAGIAFPHGVVPVP